MHLRIGIISDTHGLLRPEALSFLKHVDAIFHAGDIGSPQILGTLNSIAPVHAVRGNVDTGAWAESLPKKDLVEIGGKSFYLLHVVDQLDLDPAAAGIDAVIFGHSHEPEKYHKEGVLYLNSGSAGPKRFRLPVTIGRITVNDSGLESEIISLAL